MIKFADDHVSKVLPGTLLVAVGVGDCPLTKGKVYNAIYGAEEGIFETRPFVTVICDTGDAYSCHLSRFTLKEHYDG